MLSGGCKPLIRHATHDTFLYLDITLIVFLNWGVWMGMAIPIHTAALAPEPSLIA
jgi:hypothetical protein